MTTFLDISSKINDLFGYSPTEAQLLQRPDLITIALDAIAANVMTLTEIATALNTLMGSSYDAASLKERPDLIRLGIQVLATDASGAIADDSITEAKLASSFKETLFNKNYLKNPRFSVIQGTASGTLANSLALPTASLGYQGETEWCIAATGGTPAYAFSAASESVTFTGAASTTGIYLLQRLESKDTNCLKGKTVTFSCEISNSLLTSVTWEVFRPTTSDDTHGTIASPTQTLIASGTFFTVNSTLTRYSATFSLPSEASRGLEIRLRVGAQTSGTWVVSRLQLEEGSLATVFGCLDYPLELTKCRRYFQYAQYSMFFYAAVAGATIENWHPFGVQMFAPPVLGAITTDPNSSPAILNNSTATVLRQTKEGVACSFTGANIGTAYLLGYRASMSSHIP